MQLVVILRDGAWRLKRPCAPRTGRPRRLDGRRIKEEGTPKTSAEAGRPHIRPLLVLAVDQEGSIALARAVFFEWRFFLYVTPSAGLKG